MHTLGAAVVSPPHLGIKIFPAALWRLKQQQVLRISPVPCHEKNRINIKHYWSFLFLSSKNNLIRSLPRSSKAGKFSFGWETSVGCGPSQQDRLSRKRPVVLTTWAVKYKKWAQAFKLLGQFESQETDSSITDRSHGSMRQKHNSQMAQSSFFCYVTGSRPLTLQPRDAYVRGIHMRLMGWPPSSPSFL